MVACSTASVDDKEQTSTAEEATVAENSDTTVDPEEETTNSSQHQHSKLFFWPTLCAKQFSFAIKSEIIFVDFNRKAILFVALQSRMQLCFDCQLNNFG